MQVRKEKEAELFANDQYWANRLKKQEEEFLKNNKIMEKEFNDTVSFIWFFDTCSINNPFYSILLDCWCQETVSTLILCKSNSTMPGLES